MRLHLAFYFYEFLQYKIVIYLVICFVLFSGISLHSQANIAFQNFESSGSNYNYSKVNGSLQIGNSSAADRPATAAFFVSSNTALRVTNTTATLSFDNITGLGSYYSKKITIRLAAFSIASSSNGMDVGDKVTISVSLNGGISFSNELTIKGNSNAYWHYTTGTGLATVSYDGNNSPAEYAPAGGGNRTMDGYSALTVLLPDSCKQMMLKIVINSDSNNEAWLIDDVLLKACYFTTVTCPEDSTVCINSGLLGLTGGSPSGGVYSGPGVSNGIFNPVVAGLGMHTLTYTYTDPYACSNSCNFQFSVNSSAIHNVQSDLDYCSLQTAIYANETSDGDEIEIPAGTYLGSCIDIAKNIKLTPLISGIAIPCLKMSATGKYLILGADLTINQVTLNIGKIRTNGNKLFCKIITGANPSSYIITD